MSPGGGKLAIGPNAQDARGYWPSRMRILFVCLFSGTLYWLFDPFEYFPLNLDEKVRSLPWLWIALLALMLLARVGREAFWISVYLIAPFVLLDGAGRLLFGLVPNAVWYRNWLVVAPETLWCLPFYALLAASIFWFRTRVLGLVGFICSVYLYAVLMAFRALIAVSQGLPFQSFDPRSPGSDLSSYSGFGLGYLIPGLLVSVFLLVPLWREARRQDAGRYLDLARFPDLNAFLSRLSNECRTELPEQICVSSSMEVVVHDESSWLGLPGQRVLTLGAPTLAVLSQKSLYAILLHEIAHFSLDHWRLHAAAYRAMDTLGRLASVHRPVESGRHKRILKSLISFWFWGPMPTVLALALKRFSLPARRDFELHADAFAARHAGKDTAITAVRELEVARECYWIYTRGASPALSAMKPNQLEDFRQFIASNAGREEARNALQILESMPTRSQDIYPSLRERIAVLQSAKVPNDAILALPTDAPSFELFNPSLAAVQALLNGAQEPGVQVLHGTISPSSARKQRARTHRWYLLRGVDAVVAAIVLALIGMSAIQIVTIARARALVEQGESSFRTGDVQAAAQAFETAIKINSRDAMAYNDDAALLIQPFRAHAVPARGNGQLQQAIDELQTAIALDPFYAKPELNLGSALYYSGNFQGALEAFRKASSIDRASGEPEHSLGAVYSRLNEPGQAAACYRRAFALANRSQRLPEKQVARYLLDCQKHNPPEFCTE